VTQNRMRVVWLPLLPGYDRQQFLVASVAVIRRLDSRRHFPHVARKVAEKAPDHVEGLLFVLGQIVDDAALANLCSLVSEFLLGNVDAERRLNYRWSAGKDLAGALDHHAEMGDTGFDRRSPGN